MILETSFPPDTRVENECRALSANGHEVHVFALNLNGDPPFEVFDKNIMIHRMKMGREFYNKFRVSVMRLPFYNLLWDRFIRKAAKGLRFDAIHVHDLPMAKLGSKLAETMRIPLVLDLHENYPAALEIWGFSKKTMGSFFLNVDMWRHYERKSVEQAQAVIVVIEEAMTRFIGNGVSDDKFSVISNTLNLEEFSSPEQGVGDDGGSGLTIAYAGGFGEHRGIHIAISAMPEILHQIPDAKLKIIGDGTERPEMETLTRHLQLNSHVEFTGWMPFKKLGASMACSDVGIVPHLSSEHTETTIPHKLFQYMYLGKPVLVSDCAPLKRIVETAEAGLVFRSGDSQSFANAILKLRDRALRQRLGRNGRKAVKERYNWSFDSKELNQLYLRLKSGGAKK